MASAKVDIIIAEATNVTLANLVHEVREGSIIKAVYVEAWLRTQSTSPGSYIMCLSKNPGTGSTFTTTQLAAMGSAENKKNVFFFSQALTNDQDADAIPVMRGWYKIPKSKQRFGLGDRLILTIFAQGALDLTHCGFQIYKEYF